MLLSEAIKVYVQAKTADGLSERTLTCYRRTLSYLLAFVGDREVGAVTVNDLRAYLADLRTRQGHGAVLSAFTIASYLTMTKAFFHWLAADGVIAENPAQRIKKQKGKRDQPKAIDTEDLRKMLDASEGASVEERRARAVLLFLADTGCRAGGLVGLKLADLHLGQGHALITEKGAKSRRVYLNPPTVAALRAWLAVRPATALPYVFIGLRFPAESQLTPSGLFQIIRRVARLAGVTGRFNPHSFRHRFAKRWLEQGGDMGRLADIMGHADIKTTWDAYAVWTENELQEAHRRFSPIADLTGKDGKDG